jgi:Mg2+/Co2+ transporter CorC
VTIRLSNTGVAATITILDMTGQIVTSITDDQPKDGTHDVQVPIANLPNGIYMVHVQSEGATLSGRFSVVR